MGTRADFYVGRGESAEWLGSIAWDGYPEGVARSILTADSEALYREHVSDFLREEDGTFPEMGWPWPWDNSQTTDWAYAYEEERIYASNFGHAWFRVDPTDENFGADDDDESDKSSTFPDMSARRNMPELGSSRSGVIAIGGAS